MNNCIVDATRLLCPLPVIKLQDTVKKLQPGDKVKIIATDPGVLQDIPAWCRVHGHTIVKKNTEDEVISIWLTVGEL